MFKKVQGFRGSKVQGSEVPRIRVPGSGFRLLATGCRPAARSEKPAAKRLDFGTFNRATAVCDTRVAPSCQEFLN